MRLGTKVEAISPDLLALVGHRFEAVNHTFTERDCMLYALGLGIGHDPCSEAQLRYVQGPEIHVMPTLAAALASPGEWMRDASLGIRWQSLVALSHSVEMIRPLPRAGNVLSQVKVTEVFDRGPGRGALIHWERELTDASNGLPLAILRARALARDNGGYGGAAPPPVARHVACEGPPDIRLEWPTTPMQALLYRLSGDLNPLHSSPSVARAAGFDRPILHGLCTLGIACFAIVSRCCGGNPKALRSIQARYTGVVYPGETLEVQIWSAGSRARFRCRVLERECTVLQGGEADHDA